MSYFNCPYCDVDLGFPDDCREPDTTYEWQCRGCNKNFIFTIEYSPDYNCSKADCLNGIGHNYEKIVGYPTEYYKNKERCSMCGKERRVEDKPTCEHDFIEWSTMKGRCTKCGMVKE